MFLCNTINVSLENIENKKENNNNNNQFYQKGKKEGREAGKKENVLKMRAT